ncbi:hypothetical protein AALO_G00087350 [Alosa alosa]|uniref:Uncharacterized protein n=1 Tax=Alosa alosa TaxID=278164 RepID=A0AAV6H2R7_9TELE|nr:hypothetical protein AALO_G00087350 [Alosa alosa]
MAELETECISIGLNTLASECGSPPLDPLRPECSTPTLHLLSSDCSTPNLNTLASEIVEPMAMLPCVKTEPPGPRAHPHRGPVGDPAAQHGRAGIGPDQDGD